MDATPPDTFDAAAAERFGEKLAETLNGGALALMLSIGHRTGLFDVMAGLEPASSADIAREAGLDERYVREWLGAMVTGGVVCFEPERRLYRLPAEHAASLTRESRPSNMASTMQWIPLLGGVEEHVVECFERGGGVPYAAYERFHAVMAEESDQTTVATLEECILPMVPGLVKALERGIDVLDVGCGSGRALNLLARRFPGSRFTGCDLSNEGIAAARAEASQRGLANTRFRLADVAELDEQERYDLVTAFDAIHDQAHPAQVLAAVARALRPDGVFLMQEIGGTSRLERDVEHPIATFLYTVSCLNCMTVSLAQGGEGLGAMWGAETAERMLAEAGLEVVDSRELPHDPINRYFTARRR